MAAPKQKHTKSRRNKRRSHQALNEKHFSFCPKCGEPVLPHRLCWNCGTYAGREVVDLLAKLTKKERKKKEKELTAQEKEKEAGKGLTMEELSKK
ncbi:MAG: 50S ribosomal protein L32 [Candidatus Portnoybacteria bacterium]|nr:50S ribosomal protein L32 [Candidatus Portnoybacteria bacterium]